MIEAASTREGPVAETPVPADLGNKAAAKLPLWLIPDYMEEILHEDFEAAKELLDFYLEDAYKIIGNITTSMLGMDAKAVVELAHTLKGSTRQLGAPEVGDLAEAIENGADKGEWASVRALVPRLKDAFEMLSLEVRGTLINLSSILID